MRHFAKGFLIGTLCICLLGLVWLFAFQPQLTAQEAQDLKAQFTTIPTDDLSGDGPAGKEEPQLDFKALQTRYPDVKGWLTIPGTVVDYPVMQSSAQDPEKYLRRNYDMKWRMAGSLFFQYDCMPDSRNLVVFGHNMNDGTMFAVLKKMADPKFRQEHPTAVLQTADGTHEYRILTALTTDTTQLPFNRTQFAGDEDFLSFAGSMLAGTGYTAQASDRLLTLVTCAYTWDGARTVVVAVEQN
ncbi:class B sortase [Gemmiger formicilis]|uniref:class B sortase n=1 Tax=Gemmiger formicilis TaxID=745368 RepID=UPI00195C339A|nr:class B sortase [Gemmiger formicilis]MBM6916396.1 class B sortase [Gemmiger formicilis]